MDSSDPPDTNGAAPKEKPRLLRKSSSMYLNVRMPAKPDRPTLSSEEDDQQGNFYMYGDASYDPTKNVQDLIRDIKSPKYRSRQVFCEMDLLKQRGDIYEWRESGRWVKYEETVEEGGKRWSKPHVASLSMHYVMELRKCLLEGVFLKDVECYSMSQIIDKFIEEWVKAGQLDPMLRQYVKNVMLKSHRHRHEKGRPEDKRRSLKRVNTSDSMTMGDVNLKTAQSAVSLSSHFGSEVSLESMDSEAADAKKMMNDRFMRKIPKGSETCNIMVGEVEDLEVGLVGFMRLNDPRDLGISEVAIPTRFIIYMLGPKGSEVHLKEMGRCIATMMVDEIFREVAYKARTVEDLLAGADEFLEQVTVLPPGEWDPKIRIEPPTKVPSQELRRTNTLADLMAKKHGESESHESHDDPDLQLSWRPFFGLWSDIKRKVPWYASDFKDAVHIQAIPALLFIFLATLTNNVTFGALLGQGTGDYMGVMECVFAGAVTSIVFALFSGQPLNILGSTGPMLVLEKIIYDLCNDNDWDFLSVRFWVGIWTTGFLLLMVIFNLSALVRYLTRFTEESFACLIALIFIVEAFTKLGEIGKDEPMRLHAEDGKVYAPRCHCAPNETIIGTTVATTTTTLAHGVSTTVAAPLVINGTSFANATKELCETILDGKWVCSNEYVSDVFLMSLILYFLCFGLCLFLKGFRNWPCFPTFVRQLIGDFSILIAIIICVGIDAAVDIPTPKLTVPSEFKPTKSDVRGWLVEPISPNNPWWLYLAAGLPAILATILIFMDQQITAVIVNRKEHKLVITAVIVNRKEHKLVKGKGYHLDLLVVAVLVVVHSLLGLPWYVAATVNAIAHVNSLRKESECTAPGEKPTFLGCREQRVTALCVGILSAAAVFITNVLKVIPMPVLYGVFFYMGWSALGGMQFIDRLLLIFMPIKYQPDYPYLRHVPLWRVHIFTFIQLLCVAALWVVKSIKSISIVFPLLVVFTGVVRKIIECFFTQKELMYIDSLLPSRQKKEKIDKETPDDIAEEPVVSTITDGVKNGKASFFIHDESKVNNKQGILNSAFDTKL
ncbi:hypothetical protein ACOMHN_064940 [Nucella lapillus]